MSDVHVFRRHIVCRNRSCGFRGTERGSIPLPINISHSRFGTVFRQTYRQALTGLSWLSYSRAETYSAARTRHGPAVAVARGLTPHAGAR